MYYKVDKNKGSISFQAVYDDATLHIACFVFLGRQTKWLPHYLLQKWKG